MSKCVVYKSATTFGPGSILADYRITESVQAWEGLDDFRRYDHERDDGSWSSRGNGSLAFFVRRLIATLRKILIVLLRNGNNISCSAVS